MPTTTVYNGGAVVLLPFPFSDQTSVKIRPAVIAHSPYPSDDLLVVAVTSVGEALRPGEFPIEFWREAGLIHPSFAKRAVASVSGGLVRKRGTTDLAIYVNGDVWHTMVIAVGGNHITQDIAHGLRLPFAQAEDIKKQQGYAVRAEVGPDEYFSIRPVGEDRPVQINRQDLAHIIEARVTEIFSLTLQEIKRSGYDGLLPAGMVLTGGTSALPGIKRVASEVLNMPVRSAQPENLTGLVDRLNSPAYSTGVGLLRWIFSMHDQDLNIGRRSKGEKRMDFGFVRKLIGRILP